MKRNYKLLLLFLLFAGFMRGQTTEDFESESTGASSFTDNGKVFNITSTAPAVFDVSLYSGGGWNGTAIDNKFIDNSGTSYFNTPVQFSISAANASAFTLKQLYLFIAKSDLGLNVTGSITITGKLGGTTVFTATANSPFNTNMGVNNGFTLFDMATFGGVNNTSTAIDQYVITSTGNIAYVALDTMTWDNLPCISPASMTNPTGKSIYASGTTSFNVVASNANAYQWQVNTGTGFQNISNAGVYSGATTATLTITGATSGMNGYTYKVIATGNCGLVAVSTNATLTVNAAPSISQNPFDSTICEGDATLFFISASNTTSYQWQVSTDNGTNWSNISNGSGPSGGFYTGATSSVMIINNVSLAMNGYRYRAVASGNSTPSATSNVATVTVIGSETYYEDLDNDGYGNFEVFTASCSGAPEGYVSNSLDCNDSNNSVYPGALEILGDSIDNDCDGIVDNPAPEITQGPANSSTCAGGTTTFSVVAINTTSYQWEVNSGSGFVNLSDTGIYSGTSTATLTLTGVTAAMNGYIYRAIALGTVSVTSATATLSITSAPSVTQNPFPSTICQGDATLFYISASNATTGYQWQVSTDSGSNWSNISNGSGPSGGIYSGATSSVMIINNASLPLNGNRYRAVVSGACTPQSTSSDALLTVIENVTYYEDLDNDGYGNFEVPTTSCSGAPEGYVSNSLDCNDSNDSVYPGALEIGGDSLDNDCDGTVDNPAPVAYSVTGGGFSCSGSTVSIGIANSEIGTNYQLKRDGTAVGIAVAGTGSSISFGDFNVAGTYTVLGSNVEYSTTTEMLGSAEIVIGTYLMAIKQNAFDCESSILNLSASLASVADFEGLFAPSNWNLTNVNTNGSVNVDNTPNSFILVGGNDTSVSGAGFTDYSIVMSASGTLSFSWDYTTNDGTLYDYPQTVYNGVPMIFNQYNLAGNKDQNGTLTMQVEEGNTFTIRMHTIDNLGGSATLSISNFMLSGTIQSTPSLVWTASNGGMIDGATTNPSVNVLSVGTYTLTANVGGCTFTKSITVSSLFEPSFITTWNGTAWTNGAPLEGMKAIIDGPLVVDNFMVMCELEITENGSLTVQSGGFLGVKSTIDNNATSADFVVENNGVVAQSKDVQNEGPVTVHVNSFPLYRQDYTLWSSPVKEQNLRSFSLQTLFNRFSSYNPSLGTVGEYVQEIFTMEDVATKEFVPANGYLIRMPNNWAEYLDAATPGVSYEGMFTGVPQNGTITVPLSTANVGMNLVGNPYPSPIMISEFFDANPNIDETIYFWRKRNGAAGSGYATYNNMGFVSLQPNLSSVVTAFNNLPVIATGQGFFVKNNGATQLNFNNSMRNFQGNGVFLKGATQEKHRFRLNLSNSSVVVGQTLIGYVDGGTTGVDTGFDSSYFNDSNTALTSLISGAEYIIQGLGLPFDATNSVLLGFKTDVAGTFSISLDTFDGFFAVDQNIYVKDNFTGQVHNVKESAYSFVSDAGIFNNRFEVVYQNAVLGTENPILDSNKVIVYKQEEAIHINTMSLIMQKVELYDVGGRLIQELNDVNESKAQFNNLNLSNQVLLVKITTTDKKVITKKVVY